MLITGIGFRPGLLELHVVAHILRHSFFGRVRSLVNMHFALATVRPAVPRGGFLRPAAELVHLFLHTALHRPHAPPQHDQQHRSEQQKTQNHIKNHRGDAFQQGGGHQRKQKNHQYRQRITLHESDEAVDDCRQKFHRSTRIDTLQR